MEMISFEKAFEIVMNSGFSMGTEVIPFTESLNRVLAEDVVQRYGYASVQ